MAEHYFSKKPSSAFKPTTFTALLRGHQLTFTASSGVFSKNHIDKGTEVLITYAEVKGTERMLDLGCGYGPVGIAMKRAYPDLDVLCTDINQRAVLLTKQNAKSNKVVLKARTSDGYEKIKEHFDLILLNPPQTAGKKICLKLISDSFEHLESGGVLQIVARHQKGGAALSSFMEDLFGNMRVIKRKSGYRVYLSFKE